MLLKVANSMLRERFDPRRVMKKHWFTRFIKRFSQYKMRQQKSFATYRKNAHNFEMVLNWFYRFETACKECEVDFINIYNINEIEFRVEIEKSQWVIIEEWNKSLYQTNVDNKDYIISVKCIDNSRYTFPSMMIMIEKQHLINW